MSLRVFLLAGVCLAAFLVGGCAMPTAGAGADAPRRVGPVQEGLANGGPASGGATIASAELDELTRAFADRYVGLLSSACDALKKDNPDLMQRREAQELLVNGATNVYDIASNPDAFTRVLDLTVVITLASQVWIDDDRATEVYGDRAEVLIRALHHGRVEIWALAAQVLRPDQLDLLDYLLWDWRRQNPHMVRVYSVRFSNFAIGRGKSANAEVLEASGLFANVGQAGQAIEEAHLLTERVFYQLKREPTLLRWQIEALRDATLATPEVHGALGDVDRLTDQVERLPKNVAAEREALLAALDERADQISAAVANARAAIREARQLVVSVESASDSINKTLKTADPLFTRFEQWDRWSVELPDYRKFDIREYTEAMQELAATADQVNEVLATSDELLGSSDWDRRIQQVNRSADERIMLASEQSQLVVSRLIRHAYIALAMVFLMLAAGLAAAFVLLRRFTRSLASCTHGPRPEHDRAADREETAQ